MSPKNEDSVLKQGTTKSSKKKYVLVGTFASIICLAVFGWLNRDLIVRYYHYSKIHHFSQGDKVYVRDKVFKDTSFKAVFIYQLIRPLTQKDIDESNLNELQKSLAKESLVSSKELKIIRSDKAIVLDSLRKNGNSLAGIFKDKIFITKTTHKGENLTLLLYAISPLKNIIAEKYFSSEEIPHGYTVADNKYYIMYWDSSDK